MRISAIFLLGFLTSAFGGELKYAPAPVDNPLKGLVPYLDTDKAGNFPHSLKFQYFSLKKLMTGPDQYDWTILEKALSQCQNEGCQLVMRIYMEYPGETSAIPEFLIENGLTVTKWEADGDKNVTPDYEDPELRDALVRFISAFGAQYDGDPRIGFITVGLLGMWGEWHNYPREDLWASKETQGIVLDAFEANFTKTRALLRYPAGNDDELILPTAQRPFGYHDDSFAWATLITGKSSDEWFFNSLLEKAGATEIWKTQPIGGETRPELWKTLFTPEKHKKNQGFDECVQATHATWLMDSGLFEKRFPVPAERFETASKAVRKMGYEFYVSSWEIKDGQLEVEVENRGVAPFYYSWPVVVRTIDSENTEKLFPQTVDLHSLLPGESAPWEFEDVPVMGAKEISIGIPNPMKNGKTLRFANEEQNGDWLILK